MSTTPRRLVSLLVLCARVTAFAAAVSGCTRSLPAHDRPAVVAPAAANAPLGCELAKGPKAPAPPVEIGMCLADGR